MIQHVYEAVAGARRIDRIIVATDDERIADAVRAFGGEVAMTRADHPSGTDRVAEVVAQLTAGKAGFMWDRLPAGHSDRQDACPTQSRQDACPTQDAGRGVRNAEKVSERANRRGGEGAICSGPLDLVVNVQGDEPEMDASAIDKLVTLMGERPGTNMGSIACPFKTEADLLNPACVKVVLDRDSHALYFSRSLIPYPRDAGGRPEVPGNWLLHLGIYAYRPALLSRLTATPPCELERAEQLEQLRALWLGEKIAIAVVPDKSAGIDTPEQYAAFVERYKVRSAK